MTSSALLLYNAFVFCRFFVNGETLLKSPLTANAFQHYVHAEWGKIRDLVLRIFRFTYITIGKPFNPPMHYVMRATTQKSNCTGIALHTSFPCCTQKIERAWSCDKCQDHVIHRSQKGCFETLAALGYLLTLGIYFMPVWSLQ